MKKILSIVMIAATLLTVFAFAGCSDVETGVNEQTALKLGLGVAASVSATDATEEKDGQGQATFTVATVLVDEAGMIVKAFIDCADNKVNYTVDGKAVANEEFKTKYELGDDYNMVAYGNATAEWYAQADAFSALVAGKTADEVLALVAEDAKGTEEVINAGCTIYVSDFAKAVAKAVNNAAESAATIDNTLKLGVHTAQSTEDATDEKAGSNKVTTTVFAAAVDAEGKVVTATSDCAEVTFGFDLEGKSTYDATAEFLTKKEKGEDYGMKAYAGSAKEWYEQAAAFDAACAGKTAEEIATLMNEEYKGVEELQAAGCTIYVSDFVKAAAKIG